MRGLSHLGACWLSWFSSTTWVSHTFDYHLHTFDYVSVTYVRLVLITYRVTYISLSWPSSTTWASQSNIDLTHEVLQDLQVILANLKLGILRGRYDDDDDDNDDDIWLLTLYHVQIFALGGFVLFSETDPGNFGGVRIGHCVFTGYNSKFWWH